MQEILREKKKPNVIVLLGLGMKEDGGAFNKKKGKPVWERQ